MDYSIELFTIGGENAGLLHEVPDEKGHQGPQENHHEERQTGDTGSMPGVWNQAVQDR